MNDLIFLINSEIDTRLRNMELFLIVCILNRNYDLYNGDRESIGRLKMQNIIDDALFEESRYKTLKGLFKAVEEIQNEIPYVNKNGEIESLVSRDSSINIHAVSCVCLSLKKQCLLTIQALDELRELDNKHTRRNLLFVSFKLAAFFDFLYSAI